MELTFYKYHGNGNDFILIDNRDGSFPKDLSLIQKLCHRHFGIGSDGLILLENNVDCDFTMDFYNPDGTQSLCGNGSRCSLQFAKSLGIIQDKAKFLAIDGLHEGRIEDGVAFFKLHDVDSFEIEANQIFVNTGSPHLLQFVEDVDKLDVVALGREIRYSDRFKNGGTNVNFVERKNGLIKSRTYERGVEDETFSSGTGTTAIALSSAIHYNLNNSPIEVNSRGGKLQVSFEKHPKNAFSNIWLSGIVEHVYTGTIDV